jgi:hypothetical protein
MMVDAMVGFLFDDTIALMVFADMHVGDPKAGVPIRIVQEGNPLAKPFLAELHPCNYS